MRVNDLLLRGAGAILGGGGIYVALRVPCIYTLVSRQDFADVQNIYGLVPGQRLENIQKIWTYCDSISSKNRLVQHAEWGCVGAWAVFGAVLAPFVCGWSRSVVDKIVSSNLPVQARGRSRERSNRVSSS